VVLVGKGRVAVVDPASPYPEERAALDDALAGLAAGGETIERVLLTHHHVDHISGAAYLAARLGVPVGAHAITAERLGGRLAVDQTIDDGELLPYGPEGFQAILTPGHAPGHLCFLDPASRAIVAGDMVASVGTIIIEPEDGGDMIAYLASLERLIALRPSWLLPAHGPPIPDPDALLRFYIAHRLEREARVLNALSASPSAVADLVPLAYPDVLPAIYPLAARSLTAHLEKLEREGRARRDGDRWARV
jgi:glyoxylase-like metal-dependent hydrolase (beta-lactamase superfamily II)